MSENLGAIYGTYGTPMFKEFPHAVEIAAIDESESYEVDQTSILVDADGTFILAVASGCSCWEGDWELTRFTTVEELLDDIGPAGKGDYSYNPSFAGVKELGRQVAEWRKAGVK